MEHTDIPKKQLQKFYQDIESLSQAVGTLDISAQQQIKAASKQILGEEAVSHSRDGTLRFNADKIATALLRTHSDFPLYSLNSWGCSSFAQMLEEKMGDSYPINTLWPFSIKSGLASYRRAIDNFENLGNDEVIRLLHNAAERGVPHACELLGALYGTGKAVITRGLGTKEIAQADVDIDRSKIYCQKAFDSFKNAIFQGMETETADGAFNCGHAIRSLGDDAYKEYLANFPCSSSRVEISYTIDEICKYLLNTRFADMAGLNEKDLKIELGSHLAHHLEIYSLHKMREGDNNTKWYTTMEHYEKAADACIAELDTPELRKKLKESSSIRQLDEYYKSKEKPAPIQSHAGGILEQKRIETLRAFALNEIESGATIKDAVEHGRKIADDILTLPNLEEINRYRSSLLPTGMSKLLGRLGGNPVTIY